MAEGNGELVDDVASMSSQDRGDGEKTEDYPKLIEYGLDKRVSSIYGRTIPKTYSIKINCYI